MKKTKKVSVNEFEKSIMDSYIPSESVTWNGIEINIKKTLSLKEVMTFVGGVTNSCFTTEENIYTPEVKDFAIKYCIIEMYTNITLPANTEKKYDLIYRSDIIPTVLKHINNEQYCEIIRAIDSKIGSIVQANTEAIRKQLNEMHTALESLNSLQEKASNMFSGISSEDITNLIKTVTTLGGDGKLDENKLVQAYLSQTKEKK